ncbi:MAG: thiamine-binding protein [Actinomycetota bacterium]
MLTEIQVLPSPTGDHASPYRHVDAAIAVISAAGLPYEVGALGTTFEGPPDRCWEVARSAHEACLRSGADSVVTIAKLYEARDPEQQASMEDLTGPHRS